MSVCLLPFLKLLSVGADLSSWLILDQRFGPKCLRECSPYFVVLRPLGKISFDAKSLQIEAKSCDFILNPDVGLFHLLVVAAAGNKNECLGHMDQT